MYFPLHVLATWVLRASGHAFFPVVRPDKANDWADRGNALLGEERCLVLSLPGSHNLWVCPDDWLRSKVVVSNQNHDLQYS